MCLCYLSVMHIVARVKFSFKGTKGVGVPKQNRAHLKLLCSFFVFRRTQSKFLVTR
jgi:hypothetical protein